MSKKAKKGNWIVRVKCSVLKDVCCSDCTEEQARTEPFEHAHPKEQQEIDQLDWEVKSVEPND